MHAARAAPRSAVDFYNNGGLGECCRDRYLARCSCLWGGPSLGHFEHFHRRQLQVHDLWSPGPNCSAENTICRTKTISILLTNTQYLRFITDQRHCTLCSPWPATWGTVSIRPYELYDFLFWGCWAIRSRSRIRNWPWCRIILVLVLNSTN